MIRVRQPAVNKRVTLKKARADGFISFGADNLFPQTLLDVIDDSDTASAAMQVRAEFIEGNGINDIGLAEMPINRKGELLDDWIAAQAENLASGEVIAAIVGYNALGQKVSLEHVQWDYIRFKEPDDLGNITMAGIFPYLGSTLYSKKKDDHTLVFMYNPDPRVVLAQIKSVGGIEYYNGQLVYITVGRSRKSIYHIPSYAGGTSAFETEAELSKYDYRVVTTDLATSGMVKSLKKKTSNKDSVEDADSLANRLADHQGSDNAGSIIVVEAETQAELDAMDFVAFTGTDLSNRYNAIVDRTAERISRRTRIPNELIGIKKAGSGISFNKDQIKLSSQLMQQTVNRSQRTLTRFLTSFFETWHVPITGRDFIIENLNYFPEDAVVSADGMQNTTPDANAAESE